MKPPPPESMTSAAVVDARCGGSQRTPQRPQQQHRQWKPRQQRQQRQRQYSSKSSVLRVIIIIISGSSDGSSSSFSTIGRHKKQRQRLASALISLRRSAWREAGVTAVCLGGPSSADFGRRRLFEPEGLLIDSQSSNHARPALRLRTDGCASCASAVFAVATALIAPRSSHRARPTALVPPRSTSAHLALTPLRAHRTPTCRTAGT